MTNDKHKLGCKREAKDIGMREKWNMINDHGLKSRHKLNLYHLIDKASVMTYTNLKSIYRWNDGECDYDWFFFIIIY